MAVTRSKNVPMFGPPIPQGALFPKAPSFAKFLLTKVINAENAAHRSDKFVSMATRTRQEYLKDLATNYISQTTLDSGSKFGKKWRLHKAAVDSCNKCVYSVQLCLHQRKSRPSVHGSRQTPVSVVLCHGLLSSRIARQTSR